MDELRNFIKDMRQQNLSDELIYKNLIQKGWDKKLVNEAFLPAGTVVPVPSGEMAEASRKAQPVTAEQAPDHSAASVNQANPSLDSKSSSNLVSSAQSALHHIFLWVFSLAFIVNIQIIIQVIIEQDFSKDFDKMLASSTSVLLITGVVYWLFYFKFIKLFKQNNQLRLQGAWTVTTIVFGGLAALGFLIGLIVSLIWSADYENLTRFSPIVIYSGLVVLTYAQINFAKPESKLRHKLATVAYPAIVLVILVISVAAASMTYLDRKDDMQLKKDIAATANQVYEFYEKNYYLPKDLDQLDIKNAKISYKPADLQASQGRYDICGNFKKADYADRRYSSYYSESRQREIHVSKYNNVFPSEISVKKAGENCFTFSFSAK